MTHTFPDDIANLLQAEGFDAEFIRRVMGLAEEHDGIPDLLVMWANEDSPEERIEIMADIKRAIKDCLLPPTHSPERTCKKCGTDGAWQDSKMIWRCRNGKCSHKWSGSACLSTETVNDG